MPIAYQKFIFREDLRRNRSLFYVFGDNVRRAGFGGQAREMRGEPNAIGIATKWAPSNSPRSFFDDSAECRAIVESDLDKVAEVLSEGRTVIVPEQGIGTGLADLPRRAPNLNRFIQDWFGSWK